MSGRLLSEYAGKRQKIRERLKDFKSVWSQNDKRIFSELCFCICTPQSKAVYCDRAISNLAKSGILFNGTLRQLKNGLKAVRFPNNKAKYIMAARRFFGAKKKIQIKNRLKASSNLKVRRWLAQNVKGIGFKEASHLLRNIGFGKDMAILDAHILRNLQKLGVIKKIPSSFTEKTYLNIENKMRAFSQRVKIPLEELDLLFWSAQTGFIFK